MSTKNNEKWLTYTCTFEFNMLGIWEVGLDGTDINETARYGNHLLVADDFGRIRVYKYPAWKINSQHQKLMGHSSHVTSVKISPDGSILASAGGMDGSILLWRNNNPKVWERENSMHEADNELTDQGQEQALAAEESNMIEAEDNELSNQLSTTVIENPYIPKNISNTTKNEYQASLPGSMLESEETLQDQDISTPGPRNIDENIEFMNQMMENHGR